MKSALCLICTTVFVGSLSFAADKKTKIDWMPCQKDLLEYCTAAIEDVEKHDCLEEAPKGKISKACVTLNKEVESKLGESSHSH